jgi:hypothetical protein
MTDLSVLDAAGRRRSPATLPGYHAGRPPHNKGMRYPADPPTVEEIVAVMRHARDDRHGWRVRASDDRRPLAWRPAHPGSARALRARPRLPARIDPDLQRQGRTPARGRYGRVGLGATAAVAERTGGAADRTAVLRHRRPNPRTTVVERGSARRVPPARGKRRRQAPLRPTPATPRTCARARPGRSAARHHPTPLGHANLGTTSIYL